MNWFKAAYINEIERMLKRKKAVVVIAISILAIVVGQLVITGFREGLRVRGASSSEFPLIVLPIISGIVVPLFTTLVTIDAFAGEYSTNTAKIALLKPITRLKLFTAKMCAIATFAFINLLLVMILSLLSGILFNASYITLKSLSTVAVAYLVTLIPVMVIALLVTVLCHIFKSTTGIFFLCVGLFILSYIGSTFLPKLSPLFLTYNLSWYNLFVTGVPLYKIIRILLIMGGYGIMFFTGGYYMFDKRNH